MPAVPGLRSPFARVGRIVYFGRMLDKIRLNAAGLLPADYQANLGAPRPQVFDARCCRFLKLPYDRIRERTLAGGADEEVLAWAESQVAPLTEDDCFFWNSAMTKIGWRDGRRSLLEQRAQSCGIDPARLLTFFDLLDIDEGREPQVDLAWSESSPLSVLIVMGVAGAGKTTVGQALAGALGWDFADGDDFHPASNVAKMRAGVGLNDADRAPWLEALASHLRSQHTGGRRTVLACSALKAGYRRVLAPDLTFTRFVHLKAPASLLETRLASRSGHFAGSALIPSQLEALEPPLEALALDAERPVAELVHSIRQRLWL